MVVGIKDWFYRQEGRKAHSYGEKFNLYEYIIGFIGDGKHPEIDGYIAVEVEEILKETEKALQIVVDGWKFWIPKSLTNMNMDGAKVQELRDGTEERRARYEAMFK